MDRQIQDEQVDEKRHVQKLSSEALAKAEDLCKKPSIKVETGNDNCNNSGVKDDALQDCLVCGKTYSNISSLIDHVEGHSKDEPIQCRLCAKYFRNTSKFRPHLRNSCKNFINQGNVPHEPHRAKDQVMNAGKILSRARAEFQSQVYATVDNSPSSSENQSDAMRNLLLAEWSGPARWAGNQPSERRLRLAQAQAHITEVFTHSCHLCGMTFCQPSHLQEHAAEHETRGDV